jgi:hypothetical protein
MCSIAIHQYGNDYVWPDTCRVTLGHSSFVIDEATQLVAAHREIRYRPRAKIKIHILP